MTVWREVEEALESIIDDYESVNHVISLFQDDRNRREGLKRIMSNSHAVCLELGSGPGNFSKMLTCVNRGPIVCLDFSYKMHLVSRKRNRIYGFNYVRAVFEALPFRDAIFGLVAASYSLRDSLYKSKAFGEAASVMVPGGRFLLVDIGKPDKPIIRDFVRLYIKFIVPIIGGLAARYGYKNPWSLLYSTFELLPSNKTLKIMLSNHLRGDVKMRESIFGAIITVVGVKADGI